MVAEQRLPDPTRRWTCACGAPPGEVHEATCPCRFEDTLAASLEAPYSHLPQPFTTPLQFGSYVVCMGVAASLGAWIWGATGAPPSWGGTAAAIIFVLYSLVRSS